MLAAVSLTKCIERDPVTRPSPLKYTERTQQILPLNVNHLQRDLDKSFFNLYMIENYKSPPIFDMYSIKISSNFINFVIHSASLFN